MCGGNFEFQGLPGESGLLGDEAVDNLAGLAFRGILRGGESGTFGSPESIVSQALIS